MIGWLYPGPVAAGFSPRLKQRGLKPAATGPGQPHGQSPRFREASLTYPANREVATAMTPVRFGLIGFGAWGSHHARAIAQTAGAELVAIAARTEKSCAAARAAHPAARVYDDYRALLERE